MTTPSEQLLSPAGALSSAEVQVHAVADEECAPHGCLGLVPSLQLAKPMPGLVGYLGWPRRRCVGRYRTRDGPHRAPSC